MLLPPGICRVIKMINALQNVRKKANGGDGASAPSADVNYTTSSASISGAKCGSLSIKSGKKCQATVASSSGAISYSEI
ncbi:MAG: hypothetical protein EB123_06890 [Synechococcaceae bacterium WBB_32_011]|nr:hypothetical protein [Synechococcaceae bacterium WBB_32_011]